MRQGLIIAMLGLVLGLAPAIGNDISPGEAQLNAKSYGTAYLMLRQEAAEGSVRAKFLLGVMSDNGLGPIALDPREAARWYRLAAEEGDMEAQYRLASAQMTGRGVARDLAEAAFWLEQAAEQGFTPAFRGLAELHRSGRVVGGNPEQTAKLLERAAKLGDAESQFAYGSWLEGGGTTSDPKAALQWYRRAAEQGHVGAQVKLGRSLADAAESNDQAAEGFMWLNVALRATEDKAKASTPKGKPVKDEAALMRNQVADIRKELASRMPPYQIADAENRARNWKPISNGRN